MNNCLIYITDKHKVYKEACANQLRNERKEKLWKTFWKII